MKRFIAFVLVSTLLAIAATGCAHSRLQRASAKEVLITSAVIAGVVLMATTYNCANCNIGSEPSITPR